MKKIILILIIHCSLLIVNSFSQSFTWIKTYNGPFNHFDYGRDVCFSTNGNFLVAGYTFGGGAISSVYVLKLNPYGDTIWTRVVGNLGGQYEGFGAAVSGDGGCVATGLGDTNYTLKLSSDGQVTWFKYYGNKSTNWDIQKTSDGGYIACGQINYWDGYALKVDSLGNLQWQKVYYSNYAKVYYSVVEAYDGGYIMVGVNKDFEIDTTKAVITKIDTSGNVVWEKKYRVRDFFGGPAQTISKVNGSYLIGINSGESISFLKINLIGDTLYSNVLYTPVIEYFYDLKVINSNRYVFALGRDTLYEPYRRFKMLVTDSVGTIIYDRTLPGTDYYIQNASIMPMPNGDIVFAGTIQYEYSGDRDVFVMRTDSTLYAPPIIGIHPISNKIPSSFNLFQNYPNPFNPETKIKFEVPTPPLPSPKERGAFSVKLVIYDILGREVATLVNEQLKPGSYEVEFDGSNFASGIYFYRLITNDFTKTKKMVLLK